MNKKIIQQLDEIEAWLRNTPNESDNSGYRTKSVRVKNDDVFNRKVMIVGHSKYINNPGDKQMTQAVKNWSDEEEVITFGYKKQTFYFGQNTLPRESFNELFDTVKRKVKDNNNNINWQLESRSDNIRVESGLSEKYR